MNHRSRGKSLFYRLARTALEAVLPGVCCACGILFRMAANPILPSRDAPMIQWFDTLLGGYLCPGCRGAFDASDGPMCVLCGEPFASPHGLDHLCGSCRDHPPRFSMARSVGCYRGPLRATIHQYKYRGRERLGDPLGRLLWELLNRQWDPVEIDRVMAVPLHPRRMRRRGFDQAHTLIRRWPALARAEGLMPSAQWVDDGTLIRHRSTRPQTGLTKAQRAENLTGAFALRKGGSVRGLRIALIDDVLTTGATADACARVLLEKGASEVRVLTVAKAV